MRNKIAEEQDLRLNNSEYYSVYSCSILLLQQSQPKNKHKQKCFKMNKCGLPCGAVDKNSSANAGDMDSVFGLGRFHMLKGN